MTLTVALIIAGVFAIAYAAFLALSDFGLWLRQELTWLTVVIGCGATLGCIALVDVDAAGLAGLFFAVTGTPIVVESLIRTWRNHRAAQRAQMGPRDGE